MLARALDSRRRNSFHAMFRLRLYKEGIAPSGSFQYAPDFYPCSNTMVCRSGSVICLFAMAVLQQISLHCQVFLANFFLYLALLLQTNHHRFMASSVVLLPSTLVVLITSTVTVTRLESSFFFIMVTYVMLPILSPLLRT